MVVFVTRYHKGFEYHGDVKIIHRYLPREVGELVVWYEWLVLPFVQRMQCWLWPSQSISHHLWGPNVDVRKWTTERMKEHLQRATAAGLGHKIHVAAYRHIAIAISRRWVRASSAFSVDDGDPSSDDIADEQATHSPFTAGAVYAREMQELPGSTAERRQQFRTASVDWHRFLGFQSSVAGECRRGIKRQGDPFELHGKRARVERQERLRRVDPEDELSWMMREPMSLRGVQGTALQAIQQGHSKIIVVMPTGGGKSMLFMLPAFVSQGGVTVVVVPFTSLRGDMTDRCRKLGIRCVKWDGRRAVDGASIVLVTPEATTTDAFQRYLRRMRQIEMLDRIVIDECHVILGNQGGFRPHLQQLGKLQSAHTQMLLLTATLAPIKEPQLLQRMFWEPQEVCIVRSSTVRSNIAYSIVDAPREVADQIQQLAEYVVPVWQVGGKAVVLCDDKRRIDAIVQSGAFPCEAFHADMSTQAREAMLKAFREGQVQVLIATSTFGVGIDVPDIRVFINITTPDNIREYAQSSGRAGRDGAFSRAVLIRNQYESNDGHMQEYTNTWQCRRIKLDRHFDNDHERTECQEGDAACDFCQAQRQTIVEVPVQIVKPVNGVIRTPMTVRPAYQTPVSSQPSQLHGPRVSQPGIPMSPNV